MKSPRPKYLLLDMPDFSVYDYTLEINLAHAWQMDVVWRCISFIRCISQLILVYWRVTHSIPPFVEIKVDVQNACLGEHARHNEKREMDGGWTFMDWSHDLDDFLGYPISQYQFTGQLSNQPDQNIGTKSSAWKTMCLLRMVLLVVFLGGKWGGGVQSFKTTRWASASYKLNWVITPLHGAL